MDDIPYEFIDKVLTQLDYDDSCNICLKSGLWSEAVRVYKKRLQYFEIAIYPNENGLCYRIQSSDMDYSFEKLLRMDHRFNRVDALSVKSFPETAKTLSAEELPNLVRFLASFTLDTVTIVDQHGDWQEFCEKLFDLLTKSGLRTISLDIGYNPGASEFLRSQLKNPELTELTLRGVWPCDLQDKLQAFVCRPSFEHLRAGYDCFDVQTLKAIVSYWKALPIPWDGSRILMKSRLKSKEFASWMYPASDSTPHYYLACNQSFVRVKSDANFCELIFLSCPHCCKRLKVQYDMLLAGLLFNFCVLAVAFYVLLQMAVVLA